MVRQKHGSTFIFIAIILAFIPTLMTIRPATAMVNLQYGRGEAVWFYRSCTSPIPGTVANWTVNLNPSVSNGTSLNFRLNNAYPGYRLTCELYFANSGKLSFAVHEIKVYNPNPDDLHLSATVAAAEQNKIIQPCNSRPAWGMDPSRVPAKCQSRIKVILALGQNIAQNNRMEFGVRVRLEEKIGNTR